MSFTGSKAREKIVKRVAPLQPFDDKLVFHGEERQLQPAVYPEFVEDRCDVVLYSLVAVARKLRFKKNDDRKRSDQSEISTLEFPRERLMTQGQEHNGDRAMAQFWEFGFVRPLLLQDNSPTRLSTERVADSEFERRTIDRADLDFGKQPFALADAGEKMESGPDIGGPVPDRAETEDIGCRTTA